jgi:hypothetical protein
MDMQGGVGPVRGRGLERIHRGVGWGLEFAVRGSRLGVADWLSL